MTPAVLTQCASCGAEFPAAIVNAGPAACPACGARVEAAVFPRLFGNAGDETGRQALDFEATCYYHEQKRAERVCDSCGVFMCGVCDTPVGDARVCPRCVERDIREQTSTRFVHQRLHYDSVALLLAVLSILFLFPFYCLFPLGLLAATLAIVLSVYYWRKSLSLLPRRRWRFVLAVLLGTLNLLVVAGGAAFFVGAILMEEF